MGKTYCGRCGKCTYDGNIEDSYQPCSCLFEIFKEGELLIGDNWIKKLWRWIKQKTK